MDSWNTNVRVSTKPGELQVSPKAFEQMCELAPRWDKHMLESQYIEWAKTKDPARNEDARFLRWVTSFTKGKPAP